MLERFALEEVLHSTLTRLRGKYSVLSVMESSRKKPDVSKINHYTKRSREITVLMDTIIDAPVEIKKSTIKEFSKELRTLNEQTSSREKVHVG